MFLLQGLAWIREVEQRAQTNPDCPNPEGPARTIERGDWVILTGVFAPTGAVTERGRAAGIPGLPARGSQVIPLCKRGNESIREDA